jgi:hypothetical protein
MSKLGLRSDGATTPGNAFVSRRGASGGPHSPGAADTACGATCEDQMKNGSRLPAKRWM